MVTSKILLNTLKLVIKYHNGILDYHKDPMTAHLIRVANMMDTNELKVIALLHDTLEDTECSLTEIIRAGVPAEAIEHITILTRKDGIPYKEYISLIKECPKCRRVKLADLMDNFRIGCGLNDGVYQQHLWAYQELLGEELKLAKTADDIANDYVRFYTE